MPGVNLSQSIAEKSAYQAKSGGEKGRFVVFGAFFLTLVVWGGVRIGLFTYDKKIATLKQQVEQQKLEFEGPAVSDIADIDARLSILNQEKMSQIYPKTVLVAIEEAVLPANRLTSFDYDFEKNTISIEGEASGYKEVAQQVMSFKASPRFSDILLASLSKEKEGDNSPGIVKFGITLAWVGQK